MQSLEHQVRQLAKVNSEHPSVSFTSNTEKNPREYLKAIDLRSRKQVETRVEDDPSVKEKRVPIEADPQSTEPIVEGNNRERNNESQSRTPLKSPKYKPLIPYSARLKKNKDEVQFRKFINISKQLQINILIVEALTQMPKYGKLLRELLTSKRKLEKEGTIGLTGNCLAILEKKLQQKLKDLECFIIPCVLEGGVQENALADSGTSTNVIPYTMYLKISFDDLRPTWMTLQLIDQSTRKPHGIVEDLCVRVDKFVFLVDFVIMDIDEDTETALILG
ncbi:uncharacterized protein LOC120278519 [Dioscorea cayenensis subsp. rotundata]|uniref:Uncharacterized protein LOC120278519 n=1 Tax=Dioscorea cayennensis subsp. rotundata TaxID=55577 RepID=A0AB40CMK7_DIOCR|nr:uncharacterized protein LOC120278519 [Dioscorea cayenensis subsp. rotundata]